MNLVFVCVLVKYFVYPGPPFSWHRCAQSPTFKLKSQRNLLTMQKYQYNSLPWMRNCNPHDSEVKSWFYYKYYCPPPLKNQGNLAPPPPGLSSKNY